MLIHSWMNAKQSNIKEHQRHFGNRCHGLMKENGSLKPQPLKKCSEEKNKTFDGKNTLAVVWQSAAEETQYWQIKYWIPVAESEKSLACK